MFSFLFSLMLIVAISTNASDQLTEAEAKHILHFAGWPIELQDDALNVMMCETSLISNQDGDNGNSIGLFQIQWEPSTWVGWKSYPQMKYLRNRNIYEPVTNAQAALIIYNNFGWGPWTCKP